MKKEESDKRIGADQNITWHGTDQNKVTSLFEYGLLVRYIPKEKSWQCVYRSGVNTFSYSWTDHKTLDELFTTGWAVKHLPSFLKFCGTDWEQWKQQPVVSKASDFISYFGVAELFGEDYYGGYSVKEICKRLHIKYESDYEQSN